MHQKTNEWAERTSDFLMHRNSWIKIVQVISMVCFVYFIHTEIFFWRIDTAIRRLEMNDCQNISFVESETRKIVQYVSNNVFRARSFSFPPKQSTSSNQQLGIRPVWHHFQEWKLFQVSMGLLAQLTIDLWPIRAHVVFKLCYKGR